MALDLRPTGETNELIHEAVGERHYFSEHVLRAIHNGDLVPAGLTHLLPVRAGEQREEHRTLSIQPVRPLKVPPAENVEFLVHASELDVRPDLQRVPGLKQRVEQVMQLLSGLPPGKIGRSGKYPKQSFNFLIQQRIEKMQRMLKKVMRSGGDQQASENGGSGS